MKRYIAILLLALGTTLSALAQNEITITGRVTDTTGEAVIGVSVIVKDAKGLGTITDFDGRYRIETDAAATLEFSYMGYRQQSAGVAGRSQIDVQLNIRYDMLIALAKKLKQFNEAEANSMIKTIEARRPTGAYITQLSPSRATCETCITNLDKSLSEFFPILANKLVVFWSGNGRLSCSWRCFGVQKMANRILFLSNWRLKSRFLRADLWQIAYQSDINWLPICRKLQCR